MKQNYVLLIVIAILLMLPACSNKNTVGGAALGGIAGGIVGTQIGGGSGRTAAIIGGTLAGAALGGYVGSYLDRMDQQDKRNLNQTLEQTPTKQTVAWANPDTNTSYQVTPKNTYKEPETERYCREYQTQIKVGGETETAYGTACRQPGGQWEVVK